MTKTYHHGDLRQAILRRAGTALESGGVEAISLRSIARALDVSHAAPAHHFAGRDDLLAALATEGFQEFADRLESAMEGRRPNAWAREIGHAYIRFALDHPERYRLMFTSRLTSSTDCPESLTHESSRAYLALLRAVHGDGQLPDAATYRMAAPELRTWALVHGAVMLWLDGQLGDVTESEFLALADAVIDDFVDHTA